jgi:small subunit ribosomal protein S5
MTEENTQVTAAPEASTAPAEATSTAPRTGERRPFNRGGRDSRPGDRKPGDRGPRRPDGRGGRPERVKPEFEQKTIDVRRVTRVVAGGRRFTFSVAIVIGDRKGRVGVGLGKAGDTALAIDKAYKQAMKKMVQLKLTKDNSIPHELSAKYNSSYLTIMPNKARGLIAGSSARQVLALAGIQNITAKFHSGSKNKLNNARCAMKALNMISAPYEKKARKEGDFPEGVKRFDRGERGDRGGDRRGGTAPARAPRRNNFFVKRKVDAKPEAPKAATE